MPAYDAFISYSHAKDKPIAAALQSVVQKLGKPWYRRRALRVFRDDTSLSATPQLWPTIEQALEQSRFLILLASPEAAASHWVGKEIAWWLERKSADTLLIAVTDGALIWDNAANDFAQSETTPLPPALKSRFAAEPKWVDLTAYRDGADKRDAKFTELAADFAAAIRGMPKEDLLSQEVKQQRRALTLAWSAATLLLVLAGAAGWQWKVALDNERAAIEQRNRAVVAEKDATEQKGVAETQRDLAVRNFGIAKDAANRVVFRIAQDLRDVEGMRVESVRRILDAAQAMMDELAKTAPDDLELQRSRLAMLLEFTETYLDAGDLMRARQVADESLAIARKLAAADPANAARQFDLGRGLSNAGEVAVAARDYAGALAAYEEVLAIYRSIAATYPDNLNFQREVAKMLNSLGSVRRDAGNRTAALSAYEESLGIRRRLVAANPDDAKLQRDLAVTLDSIGDTRSMAGDYSGALAPYEEGAGIWRKLVSDDPGNFGLQRDLAVNLDGIGEARLAIGDHVGALAAHEESLKVWRKLAASDPNNALWQRDLSVSLEKVGNERLKAGDRAAALAAYEESLAIMRRLAAADADNYGHQADLAISLFKVSTASDPPRARAALREALTIAEALARAGKLSPEQQTWPETLRDALARLPP